MAVLEKGDSDAKSSLLVQGAEWEGRLVPTNTAISVLPSSYFTESFLSLV